MAAIKGCTYAERRIPCLFLFAFLRTIRLSLSAWHDLSGSVSSLCYFYDGFAYEADFPGLSNVLGRGAWFGTPLAKRGGFPWRVLWEGRFTKDPLGISFPCSCWAS